MMRQGAISPFINVPDTIAELLAVGASVPIGSKGIIHVWGRNDTAINQKLGIHWIVKDPDGIIVEDYEGWQLTSTSPGDTHEFRSPRVWQEPFDLDKVGTWTIAIGLAMNPDSPINVDVYSGVLCVIEEEEYAGTIIKKELEYDSDRGDIPVY